MKNLEVDLKEGKETEQKEKVKDSNKRKGKKGQENMFEKYGLEACKLYNKVKERKEHKSKGSETSRRSEGKSEKGKSKETEKRRERKEYAMEVKTSKKKVEKKKVAK